MRSKWSLRGLLYALTASVVVPAGALLAYSVYSQYQEDQKNAAVAAYSLAQLTADNVQAFLSDTQQVLGKLAQRPAMRQPDCDPVFQDFKDLYPQFANLSLSSPQGYLVCSSTPQQGGKPTFVGETQWFKQVYSQQRFIVGPMYRGPVSKRMVSVLAHPVVDASGTMVGALQAPIDLLKFRLVTAADKLPSSTVIAIFDSSGNVVARSQDAEKYVGTNIRGTPIIEILLAQRQGTARSVSSQNIERIYGFLPIAGTDWLVLAGISTDVALAGARQAAVRNALSGVALLIAVSLLAFYLARRVSRPMLDMQNAARRVAAGESTVRAPVAGPLEIAEVATQFNAMLDAIGESQAKLADAQANLLLLGACVEHLYDMVLILDARQSDQGWPLITFVNRAFENTTGYSRAEAIGRSGKFLHGPNTAESARAEIAQAMREFKPARTELIHYTKAGEAIWVEVDILPVRDAEGQMLYWVSVERNVSHRKQAEVALRRSEERLKRALEGSRLALWELDLTSGSVYLSETWSQLLGGPATPTTTTIEALALLVPQEDQAGIAKGIADIQQGLTDVYSAEHRLTTVTGDTIWIVSHGQITERDTKGRATRVVGINRDISERKSREAEINRLAYYDVLTGLPNRRLLTDRLAQCLAGAKRNSLVSVLMFVDLDRFKSVNDARGHAVGDSLLKGVAARLSALLREGDTVARIGGDEFVLLLSDLTDSLDSGARAAMTIAEKVRTALERPFDIDGQLFSSSASIGVTLLPKHEQTALDLLREADTAMYRAKAAGRNQIAFFEANMQSEVEERLALERDLSLALEGNQLALHMQSQVDSAGQVVGAELLMRWHDPVRGQVPPSLFIPLAEETGMILRLGVWTLREGCRMLMRLVQAGRLLPLSINVSPRQFRERDFVEQVKAVLQETGAPANLLIFEVTEGLLIDKLDESIQSMHALAALGIRFSIDDFGTGYSSLAYLKRLPLYELKIDKSFVQDTPDDVDDSEIVQMVISMAKHLRLRVVAEGVETRAQADFLAASGCDSMQGYLFARPVPMDVWLAQQGPKAG